MIPDKLLINLKIISKIQKNGRITRSYDGIISLENDVFYQSIKRFITNDSRRQAVFEINSVVSESIDILSHILNSKYTNKNFSNTDEYIKNCEHIELILKELENTKHGIENLKFTYQNDQNIVSQIDIIILKINTTIKDVSNKLVYLQSFLPNKHVTQITSITQISSKKSDDHITSYKNSYQHSYQNSYQDQEDQEDKDNHHHQDSDIESEK